MRYVFLSFLTPLLVLACSPTVQSSKKDVKLQPTSISQKIAWPEWRAGSLNTPNSKRTTQGFPKRFQFREGRVLSYGPDENDDEEFLILGERQELPPKGIGAIPIAFLPDSIFAGKSPLGPDHNTLTGPEGESITYPSIPYRSTFFNAFPASANEPKGTIFYHTSIMMLSAAEKRIVQRFCQKGWNVIVALPSDSFYRSRLPTYMESREDPKSAAAYLARDMDLHYYEQAQAAKVALSYLKKTRPQWLQRKLILMGTSGGSFSLPAIALKNPKTWDKIVFISPGANLIRTYEKGAANIFPQTLRFIDTIREALPKQIQRIPNNEEYRSLYQEAAQLTRLHPGALAHQLRGLDLLFINGKYDHILPKEEIEEIYQALGEPERWTYPLGHHLLAVNLLTQIQRLDEWMSSE